MTFDQNKNLTKVQEKEHTNLLRQAQLEDRAQKSQSKKSSFTIPISQNNRIDTPEKEVNTADRLRSERQALKTAQIGVGLSKYRGGRVHRVLGLADTGTQAFEEGRGLRGAGKDIALSEVKRRFVHSILNKLGAGDIMLGVNTLKQARSVAKQLDEQVPRHRTGVYFVIISLALVKDFIDISTIEIFSFVDWIVDLFIWGILSFFLWGKGTWKVRLALFIAGFFEVTPGTGIIPAWTLCTMYAYLNEIKRIKEYKEQVEEINKALGSK